MNKTGLVANRVRASNHHAGVARAWLLLAVFTLAAPGVAGGQDGNDLQPAAAATLEETRLTDSDREHWSFRPLVRPQPPIDASAASAIDAFVLARLDAKDLSPAPVARRRTLIRRLYFDLLGLPPDPDEIERFEADRRPDAWPRLVDRLLASPRLGEHAAQRWLDLARFAETDGFEHDKLRTEAWRYRDWVITVLNDDLGYDQFITLQLAGDELAPEDPQARLATAFCLAGPDMPDINSQEERRHDLLNGMTSNLGSVVLGLQLGCAQCHDHKFDPISQADFYRLRAVFEPAVSVTKDQSVSVLHEEGSYDEPSYLRIRGDWQRKGAPLQPAFLRVVNPDNEPLLPLAESFKLPTSGRRLALAQWLTRSDHPLTSRVMVNRLWQSHFGFGLCRSASDFGYMGDSPTHPLLLDWLATELPHQQWSMKSLHRKIVLSSTYQQASHPAGVSRSSLTAEELRQRFAEAIDVDSRNRWLARFPRRRLQGEMIRDTLLQVAGCLNLQQGGPGVRPPLPLELRGELLKGQWEETPDTSQHLRRSVYVFARRNLRFPIFDAFDRPDANESCARRYQSTTALQSLQLLNSEFSAQMAARLTARLWQESTAPEQFVDRLFRLTLGRPPTDVETKEIMLFAAGSSDLESAEPTDRSATTPDQSRWVDVCLAIFNTNEFLYID